MSRSLPSSPAAPLRVFGLHPRTDELLRTQQVCTDFLIRSYPDGRVERSAHPVRRSALPSADHDLQWLPSGDAVALRSYQLPDGQIIKERVQAFEDGCVFLMLCDRSGAPVPASVWTSEERRRAARPRRKRRVAARR